MLSAVISATNLPVVGYRHVSRRKYYVVVKVDKSVQTAQRTQGIEGTNPVWKQVFTLYVPCYVQWALLTFSIFSMARKNSSLSFEIFADRTLRDELVGGFSDVVSSFVGTGP